MIFAIYFGILNVQGCQFFLFTIFTEVELNFELFQAKNSFIAKTEIGCQFGPIARQNTFGGFLTQDFLHNPSNDEKK